MDKVKQFLDTNTQFKLSIQHLGLFGGCFKIQLYNTTYDYFCENPVFEHYILDFDIKNLAVDFETVIMTPIVAWFEDSKRTK